MRSILLHVQDDRCLEARLQVALDLARAMEGHVSCLQASTYEFAVSWDIYATTAVQLVPEIRAAAEKLQKDMEARLNNEDVPWDWIDPEAPARYSLTSHANLSDVIVMGACAEDGGKESYSALAADIAVHAGSPVMLVPAHCKGFVPADPVVVAWNGSAQSSRALRASLPLLKLASTVHLVTVEDADTELELPAISGASYLARHGIECEMTQVPVLKSGMRDTLFKAAKERGASCIVMGAYGHTRMREILLGGVSRSMMSDPELPLLLAH
jgi:nucleotide-binding universal stress UspA family protein